MEGEVEREGEEGEVEGWKEREGEEEEGGGQEEVEEEERVEKVRRWMGII
jgi:hypothetical protein